MRRQSYHWQKRQIRGSLIAGILLILIVFGIVQLDRWIRPDVLAVCAQECRSAASVQIGESVRTVLQENEDTYNDFAVLLYDESGTVTAVETLTAHVNQVQSQLLTQINDDLQAARDTTFPVSLGTATGVWLFAGKGPTLDLRMLPIGTAEVKLVSQLEAAGINQTCHTIRAEVTVHLQAAAPFYRTTTTAAFSYLLTETVIVGTVPESYVVFGE